MKNPRKEKNNFKQRWKIKIQVYGQKKKIPYFQNCQHCDCDGDGDGNKDAHLGYVMKTMPMVMFYECGS